MKATAWIIIWGFTFWSIGFKWLVFDFELFDTDKLFQAMTFILIGVGAGMIGGGFARLKQGV